MDRFDDPMDRTAPPPSLISVSYLHHGYMVQFYCPLLVCLKKTFAVWLLLNWIYWWGSFLILENNSKLLPQLSLIEMYPFVSQKCHSCGFRFPLSCLFIVAYLAIDDLLLLFPNKYNRLGSWSLSVPIFFSWLIVAASHTNASFIAFQMDLQLNEISIDYNHLNWKGFACLY